MSEIINATTPRVLIDGAEIMDGFGRPRLLADRVNLELAPGLSSFEATSYYGEQSRGGEFVMHDPVDLLNKTADVYLGDLCIFSGLIQRVADIPDGTRQGANGARRSGAQQIVAWSFEYLLDRIVPDRSWFGAGVPVSRMFAFNGAGSRMERNRRTDRTGFSAVAQSLWTTRDIIDYLLGYFTAETRYSWRVAGQCESLNVLTPKLDPAGRSIRDILNELLSPATGYSYYVRRAAGSQSVLELVVVSLADIDVKNGSTLLVPANKNLLHVDSAIEYSAYPDQVRIEAVADSAYHKIRVTGEPIRVMATLKLSTLDKGWKPELAEEYAQKNDFERRDDKYETVYQRFALNPLAGNVLDYNGLTVSAEWDEATGKLTWKNSATAFAAAVFDRALPLPLDTPDAAIRQEYRKPILFIRDDGKFFISDKNPEKLSVGFSVLDTRAGIMLSSAYNHAAAKGEFTGTSEMEPLYHPTDMFLTVSWYTDSLLARSASGIPREANEPLKIKEIRLKGAHYWIGRSGTKITLADSLPNDTIYRDDSKYVADVCAAASVWYGRRRNLFSCKWRRILADNYLGKLIDSIYSGGSFVPSGTVVSRMSYDFNAQEVALSTDFAGLDFSALTRGRLAVSSSVTAARVSALEDGAQNIPLRQVAGGGKSAEYNGYFKVVEIPAAGNKPAMLKIIDGANPGGAIAGRTDVGDVPVMTVAKQDGTLYLVCRYVNNSYVHSFEWSAPTSGAGVEEIATVANGKIVQRWTLGRVNWKWGYII